MNIFFLDWDVKKCAQYHCDKHVVKMILETAQLLCGVHHMTSESNIQVPYKLSHKNHPCAIWTRESLTNYLYLCRLGIALCDEYSYRYNKRHKSQNVIEWCMENKPQIIDKGITSPPKAMPDIYKVKDIIQSYRNYYIGAKSKFATWKNRKKPKWFQDDTKPDFEMLLNKNYKDFKEFYDENKVKIYKSIIQLFSHIKNNNKKSSLRIGAKIDNIEWDTDFNYSIEDSIILKRDLLPFFEKIDDFETCIMIRDLYNDLVN